MDENTTVMLSLYKKKKKKKADELVKAVRILFFFFLLTELWCLVKIYNWGKLDKERSCCFAVRYSYGDSNCYLPCTVSHVWCQLWGLYPYSWYRMLVARESNVEFLKEFSKNFGCWVPAHLVAPWRACLYFAWFKAFLAIRWLIRRLLLFAFQGRNIGCSSPWARDNSNKQQLTINVSSTGENKEINRSCLWGHLGI